MTNLFSKTQILRLAQNDKITFLTSKKTFARSLMANTIVITSFARKQLEKLPKDVQVRIRVVYGIEDGLLIITVVAIDKRDSVYD